ncbi:PefC/AfrB family outer membrane usher protein [Photobacterium damselae]|uniref:PefC/AfrB family outer membrane usher protein n=1 Tax=Photobacterium damselae TaxID=38293 RepID=UPI004068485B
MKYYIRPVSLASLLLTIPSVALANSELNLDFLQNTKNAPAILTTLSDYPAGYYYVDIFINGVKKKTVDLTITPEEEKKNTLCLSKSLLDSTGIALKPNVYNAQWNAAKQCFALGDEKYTHVNFDFNRQRIDITIPQAYFLHQQDSDEWDYGRPAMRLQYFTNFNRSTGNDLSAYGDLDFKFNFQRWYLSSDFSVTSNEQGVATEFRDLSLSTPIRAVNGDFILGKSTTQSELFDDFNFYGVALRSNQSMRPDRLRGYAPVITGVADSTTRVTIKQNGYTIYSKVVPPGPYRISDLSPVNNGDLEVIAKDAAGKETKTIYPIAALPTLLRTGEYQYNFGLGQKAYSSSLDKAFSSDNGMFFLASFDYGFMDYTLNSAAIVATRYQGIGIGVTKSFGYWGAISSTLNGSWADYKDGKDYTGASIGVKYSKSLADSTDLQLVAYRYQSKGYIDYADFDYMDGDSLRRDHQKSRYEAILSHRFKHFYLSGTFWTESYWDNDGTNQGANIAASTSYKDISFYLNGNYSKRGIYNSYLNGDDLSLSFSVSVPFDLEGQHAYSNSAVSSNLDGETNVSTHMSSTVNDRMSYNLGLSTDGRGKVTSSGSVNYAFDALQTTVSASHNQDMTTISGSASGSVIAAEDAGVIFTKQTTDTLAIVNIPDIAGVSFNGSLPTDKNGNTVVYLSEYKRNQIDINTDNVPENVELLDTSMAVTPAENAIIYRQFKYQKVNRYILRVKDSKGHYLTGGSATTANGHAVGYIAANGVLLMSLRTAPDKIVVANNKAQCSFSMKNLKANSNSVQEVQCETVH